MRQIMGQALMMQKGSKRVAALQGVQGGEEKLADGGRQTAPCSVICVMMEGGPFTKGALEKKPQRLPREIRQGSLEEAGSEL